MSELVKKKQSKFLSQRKANLPWGSAGPSPLPCPWAGPPARPQWELRGHRVRVRTSVVLLGNHSSLIWLDVGWLCVDVRGWKVWTELLLGLILGGLKEGWVVAQIVKNLPARQKTWFNSWVGKIPGRRKWQPTLVFLPGKSHEQGNLVGYSPWGRRVRHSWATNTFTEERHLEKMSNWAFSFQVHGDIFNWIESV